MIKKHNFVVVAVCEEFINGWEFYNVLSTSESILIEETDSWHRNQLNTGNPLKIYAIYIDNEEKGTNKLHIESFSELVKIMKVNIDQKITADEYILKTRFNADKKDIELITSLFEI